MENNLSGASCFLIPNICFLWGLYKTFKKGISIPILLKEELRLRDIKYFLHR